MQEFLLFGQVANVDHSKILQQLAGVTRMQPQHIIERHLIFKGRPPMAVINLPSGGGSQGVLPPEVQRTKLMLSSSIYYIQLVCSSRPVGTLAKEDNTGRNGTRNGETGGHPYPKDEEIENTPNQLDDQWAIEFKDIPDPGKQAVTTRLLSRTSLEGRDLSKFVEDLGFQYVSQYVVEGHKFYDQDTTLFLHRVLQIPPAIMEQGISAPFDMSAVPDFQPLDGSKGFVLQASLEAADGNNPEVKEKAVQQMLAMKETLKQAVTLAPGDRLALDTRVPVRNRP